MNLISPYPDCFQRPYREPPPINSSLQKLYFGCSGWSHDRWLGHFYPANLDRRDFLKYYSQIFDFVEIDSSFYRPPNVFMTK
ncbi:MAG: DUF72 domain-containing protein [Nitrososphaera sp.]